MQKMQPNKNCKMQKEKEEIQREAQIEHLHHTTKREIGEKQIIQ